MQCQGYRRTHGVVPWPFLPSMICADVYILCLARVLSADDHEPTCGNPRSLRDDCQCSGSCIYLTAELPTYYAPSDVSSTRAIDTKAYLAIIQVRRRPAGPSLEGVATTQLSMRYEVLE